MTRYKWSAQSLERMRGVHPLLITVVTLGLTNFAKDDWTVIEGVRDVETQREYLEKGVTWTLDSKHLLQDDDYSHAIDLAPLPWEPETWAPFERMNEAIQQSALVIGVEIIWGGAWKKRDGYHFELA